MKKEFQSTQKTNSWKAVKKYWMFYLFLLPAVILVILFCYKPFWGIIIAFKDYKIKKGILDSAWVGFKHFEKAFRDPNFYRAIKNTLIMGISGLATSFPVTIIFTILVNEILRPRFKKVVQTITYLPYFLSWVVVGGLMYQILSPTSGIVNAVLLKLGVLDQPYHFMINGKLFVPIYLIRDISKIKRMNVEQCPAMMNRVKGIRHYREISGDRYFVYGHCEGPLAEYADLRSVEGALCDLFDYPEKVAKALRIITDNAKDWITLQIQAGADAIDFGDAECLQLRAPWLL